MRNVRRELHKHITNNCTVYRTPPMTAVTSSNQLAHITLAHIPKKETALEHAFACILADHRLFSFPEAGTIHLNSTITQKKCVLTYQKQSEGSISIILTTRILTLRLLYTSISILSKADESDFPRASLLSERDALSLIHI